MTKLDFEARCAKAQEQIGLKKLPNTMHPERVEGNRLIGASKCFLCGEPMAAHDCQFVVIADGLVSERQRYPGLCFLCHAAWQCEVGGVSPSA
jgi:hypothetical protein